jgi:hypothetical protein
MKKSELLIAGLFALNKTLRSKSQQDPSMGTSMMIRVDQHAEDAMM